jgi:hypothetical protein
MPRRRTSLLTLGCQPRRSDGGFCTSYPAFADEYRNQRNALFLICNQANSADE